MRHINHKTSMTYKSVFFLCCRWTSEDGNLIAIKLHASETCFHDLEYTCPSNKSLILKLKAINIMFNQLNMKKTPQAFGARKAKACPLLHALEKRCSICNFSETTCTHGLRRACEHSSNSTRLQSLQLNSGEAPFRFIFLTEKKGVLLSLILP